MNNTYISFTKILSIFFISCVFFLAAKDSYAASICTDGSLATGCPTCTCPQGIYSYYQDVITVGSVQLKVMYNALDVTSSFNPRIESQKPASDWFYGPYNSYDPSGKGACPTSNFNKGVKILSCKGSDSDEKCGYAKGSGVGPITLQCVNGPFKADITYPFGYYPIENPSEYSSTTKGVTNINICGQISKTLTWKVGYLSAPTGVTCGQIEPNKIVVNWNQVTGFTSYDVYRDGNFLTNVKNNTFTDAGLTSNTTYKYKIKAIREDLNGKYESVMSSETVCSTDGSCVLPTVPLNITTKTVSDSAIEVNWNPATGNVDGYNLKRWNNNMLIWQVISGSPLFTGTMFLDSDTASLSCGKNYTYRLEVIGCGKSVESGDFIGNTTACPSGALCSGIIGPLSLKISDTASYTVDSSGNAPLSHVWRVDPSVGSFDNLTLKTINYTAPSEVPLASNKKVKLGVTVTNAINPTGFYCQQEVEIKPRTGEVKVEVREVDDCITKLNEKPAADTDVILLSTSSPVNIATKTDSAGIATFTPDLPGTMSFDAKIFDSTLASASKEVCANLATGWTQNSGVWNYPVSLVPVTKEQEVTPVIYITKMLSPPSFAKWISINQGNFTVLNSYKSEGSITDVIVKTVGSIFTKVGFSDIPPGKGALGPLDPNIDKVYQFGDYENKMNLSEIIDTVRNYSNADVHDCNNIEAAPYDVTKGVLKYSPNGGSCDIILPVTQSWVIPAFSVVFIDGNLKVERNIVSDGIDSFVLVVTGNIEVGEDVRMIDANIIVGGKLTVLAPKP